MAKLAGKILFTGRIDPICIYMSGGQCLVRQISSLEGKRVKTDKKFARTMQNAATLGRASRIGSFVYGELPKEFRQFWMYKAFTGEAIQLLRQGKTDKEARDILWKTYAEIWVIRRRRDRTCSVSVQVRQNEYRDKSFARKALRRDKACLVSTTNYRVYKTISVSCMSSIIRFPHQPERKKIRNRYYRVGTKLMEPRAG